MTSILRLSLAAALLACAVPALAISDTTDSVDVHLWALPDGSGTALAAAPPSISDATDSVDIHVRYAHVTGDTVLVAAIPLAGISDTTGSVDLHLVYDRLGEPGVRITEGSGSGVPAEGAPQPAAYDGDVM